MITFFSLLAALFSLVMLFSTMQIMLVAMQSCCLSFFFLSMRGQVYHDKALREGEQATQSKCILHAETLLRIPAALLSLQGTTEMECNLIT